MDSGRPNQCAIEIDNLAFRYDDSVVFEGLTATVPAGSFTALIGENGSGKTTLIDLLMGFKTPSHGTVRVGGADSTTDPFELRHSIAYLSEKVDLPGDWLVGEFLTFNSRFYRNYSAETERTLIDLFKIDPAVRIGALSAGELRRVQVVAALAARPSLVLIDEITAVLDITGRQKLMRYLSREREERTTTVVMATNILEDLPANATHLLILTRTRRETFVTMNDLLAGRPATEFSGIVGALLEET